MRVYVNTTTWKQRASRAKAAGLDAVGKDYGDNGPMLFVRIGNQKLHAFPKFGTWGIGFWSPRDENTNLPFQEPAEKIHDHIARSGRKRVPREKLLEAICALQGAIPWMAEEYGIGVVHDPRLETLHRHRGTEFGEALTARLLGDD